MADTVCGSRRVQGCHDELLVVHQAGQGFERSRVQITSEGVFVVSDG